MFSALPASLDSFSASSKHAAKATPDRPSDELTSESPEATEGEGRAHRARPALLCVPVCVCWSSERESKSCQNCGFVRRGLDREQEGVVQVKPSTLERLKTSASPTMGRYL